MDLKVYKGSGSSNLIAENTQWETPTTVNASYPGASGSEISSAATTTGAFSLTSGGNDTAVLVTLDPGIYTAVANPATDASGSAALVEVYEVP
jgi:hypothetical protein